MDKVVHSRTSRQSQTYLPKRGRQGLSSFLKVLMVALVGGAVLSVGLGVLAGKMDWGFSLLVLLIGLSAGVSARLIGTGSIRFAWSAVIIATVISLVVHGLVILSVKQPWSAERDVEPTQLDLAIKKYLTAQICRKRGIVVFGYDEVPAEIKAWAAEQLANMSTEQKVAMIDEIFGKRINRRGSTSSIISKIRIVLLSLTAIVLAVAATKINIKRIPGFAERR